ncbi:MAG TPA: Na+/H+ antiporter NhaA, partial [Candidatus Nitrosotenuis sp.]|nr:Na+/H+ antiporter NhaA [Candidatus Nitrosotenuis sp.]
PRKTRQVLAPFQRFLLTESSGGVVLVACTLVALLWANSPWRDSYLALWETRLVVGPASRPLDLSLHHWINEGFMTLFFLLVGLEIKREMTVGELADRRTAALPLIAALGGMVAPAALYALLNLGTPQWRGWGVPMATDIAFALGLLTLLGRRAPTSLKIFLAALAIVDDIGAVLVIALFYTASLSAEALAGALVFLLLLNLANLADVRRLPVYWLLGGGLWICMLQSGVHPTVAGVLLALALPAHPRRDTESLVDQGRQLLEKLETTASRGREARVPIDHTLAHLEALEQAAAEASTPLQRMEQALHPWVTFVVVPAFCLANAGVPLSGGGALLLQAPALGIVLGLVLGKPLGILGASWGAVRLGLAELPAGVGWGHLLGAGMLAGVGFTMALFISDLAFAEPALKDTARLAVLAASTVSAAAGWLTLALLPAGRPRPAR